MAKPGFNTIEDSLGGDTAAIPPLAEGVQGKDFYSLGILGVFGFFGILGILSVRRPLRRNELKRLENLEKFVPGPSEIKPRGL